MPYCIGKYCKLSDRNNPNSVHFFTLPTRPDQEHIRTQWLVKCGRTPSQVKNKQARVCSMHFLPEDYRNLLQYQSGFGSKLFLKQDAVPRVFAEKDTPIHKSSFITPTAREKRKESRLKRQFLREVLKPGENKPKPEQSNIKKEDLKDDAMKKSIKPVYLEVTPESSNFQTNNNMLESRSERQFLKDVLKLERPQPGPSDISDNCSTDDVMGKNADPVLVVATPEFYPDLPTSHCAFCRSPDTANASSIQIDTEGILRAIFKDHAYVKAPVHIKDGNRPIANSKKRKRTSSELSEDNLRRKLHEEITEAEKNSDSNPLKVMKIKSEPVEEDSDFSESLYFKENWLSYDIKEEKKDYSMNMSLKEETHMDAGNFIENPQKSSVLNDLSSHSACLDLWPSTSGVNCSRVQENYGINSENNLSENEDVACDLIYKKPADMCNKSFQITPKEKLHQCPFCKKNFPKSSCLEQHVLIHAKEKFYCCNICNREFSQPSNFKRHLRIHTNQKF